MAANNAYIITIDERDINSGRVMEVTPKVTLTDKMYITVPANYYALVIAEDDVRATVKPCAKKKISKLISSEFVGKEIYVLFVSDRQFTSMSWGIGSLPIVYPFLGNSKVNVGANGTLLPVLTDAYSFSKIFDVDEGVISITECVSAITSAFRKCASEVLVQMFIEAGQPIFETVFLVSELDRRINKRYCTEKPTDFIDGVVFKAATVLSITVNEEDKQAVIGKYGNKKKK